MKTLIVLLIFGLFSCGQAVPAIDTKKKSLPDKTQIDKSGNQYDSSVYEKYIDPRIKEYLNNTYSGWTLPAPNRWDTVWFNQYKSDSTLVNYVSGDFDCNGMKDYAILLKKRDGVLGAYAFLSIGSSFKSVELMNFGKDAGEQIAYGLEALPPGNYNHIEPDSEEDPPPVKIKCNSVQVLNFERAAETFYWERGKLKSITTGD